MSKVVFETEIGDIAGVVHGDKTNPLILVLHGYGATSSYRNWDYIYKPLAKLGYLVVGIDMPGIIIFSIYLNIIIIGFHIYMNRLW